MVTRARDMAIRGIGTRNSPDDNFLPRYTRSRMHRDVPVSFSPSADKGRTSRDERRSSPTADSPRVILDCKLNFDGQITRSVRASFKFKWILTISYLLLMAGCAERRSMS